MGIGRWQAVMRHKGSSFFALIPKPSPQHSGESEKALINHSADENNVIQAWRCLSCNCPSESVKVNGYDFSNPGEVEVFCALILCLNLHNKNNFFNTGLCTYTKRSNSDSGPRTLESYSCLGRYISYAEDRSGFETNSQTFCCPLATYCSEQNLRDGKNTTYASPLWCSDSKNKCCGSALGCCCEGGCFFPLFCSGEFNLPAQIKTWVNNLLGSNNSNSSCCLTPVLCMQANNCWVAPWTACCGTEECCCTPLYAEYRTRTTNDSLCCCLGLIFISKHFSQWCGVLGADRAAGLDGDYFPGMLCTNTENFCCVCDIASEEKIIKK